jgi:hypothetical protein
MELTKIAWTKSMDHDGPSAKDSMDPPEVLAAFTLRPGGFQEAASRPLASSSRCF